MGRLQVSKRLNFSKGKMKKFRILQLCFNYSSRGEIEKFVKILLLRFFLLLPSPPSSLRGVG